MAFDNISDVEAESSAKLVTYPEANDWFCCQIKLKKHSIAMFMSVWGKHTCILTCSLTTSIPCKSSTTNSAEWRFLKIYCKVTYRNAGILNWRSYFPCLSSNPNPSFSAIIIVFKVSPSLLPQLLSPPWECQETYNWLIDLFDFLYLVWWKSLLNLEPTNQLPQICTIVAIASIHHVVNVSKWGRMMEKNKNQDLAKDLIRISTNSFWF